MCLGLPHHSLARVSRNSDLSFSLKATALTLYFLPGVNIASPASLLLISHFQTFYQVNSESCPALPHDCTTLKKPLGSFRSLLGQRRNKEDFQRTRTTFLPILEELCFFLSCLVILAEYVVIDLYRHSCLMSLGHYSTEKIIANLQLLSKIDSSKHMDSFRKQSWEIWLCHMHPSA